mgnify:CR=1 FL=1
MNRSGAIIPTIPLFCRLHDLSEADGLYSRNFSDSQHPHITTYAHELALPVIFESALQHMPDRPSVYYGLPEQVKQFLSALPTAWDDTKLLAGYPGTEVVMHAVRGMYGT